MIFWKQNFHRNLLFYKSISLQNLMRCETFFRNLTRSKISIQNLSSCEKTALSLTHLKFLIQNLTRCTTNDSETEKFQKIWSKKFFIKKKNFFCNNFSKNAQKSQLSRFYGVNWPDKWFFESKFSNKFCLSKNSFLIEI